MVAPELPIVPALMLTAVGVLNEVVLDAVSVVNAPLLAVLAPIAPVM